MKINFKHFLNSLTLVILILIFFNKNQTQTFDKLASQF